MISQVSLCNRALRLICAKQITSMNEDTIASRTCALAFNDALFSTLTQGNWGFALQYTSLGQNLEAPMFGYKYAYELPSNFIRVVDIRATQDLTTKPEKFSISGHCIYTNASPCYARLIMSPSDLSFLPCHFCDAFVTKLAAEIAPVLSDDAGLGLKMAERFEQEVRLSLLIDASMQNEEEVDTNFYNSFMQAR